MPGAITLRQGVNSIPTVQSRDRRWLAAATAVAAVIAGLSVLVFSTNAGFAEAKSGSPEDEARKEAAPFEKKGMRLRQDFWSGELTQEKGKAIRLQFFKGHEYRLFLAAGAEEKETGTKMHVMVIDGLGNVLAESKTKGHVATLTVKPPGTGSYMILMRTEAKGLKDRKIPAVLFYGYQ